MNLSLAQRIAGDAKQSLALSRADAGEAARTLTFSDQIAFWASIGIGLGALAPGALMMPQNSIWTIVGAAGLGAGAAGFVLGVSASSGASRGTTLLDGLAAPLTSRASPLLGLALVLRNVVWAAFLIAFAADAAAYFAAPLFGEDTRAIWCAVFAAIGAVFAVGGPHVVLPWVVKRLLAPVAILMVVIVAISSYSMMGIPDLMTRPPVAGWPNRWQGADLVALAVLAWAPIAGDFTRYAARHSGSARAAFFGFAPPLLVLAILGALYVPLVRETEAWQLLTAVPMGLLAFLMLLVFEADGITALVYSSGATAQRVVRERLGTTVAAAVAAGAIAVAFTAGELEPVAFAVGLLFLPPVILEAIDRNLMPWSRAPQPARAGGFVVSWAAAFLVGSWFYPGPDGRWKDAVSFLGRHLGLPFPMTDHVTLLGAFLPTVAVGALLYTGILVVFHRRPQRRRR